MQLAIFLLLFILLNSLQYAVALLLLVTAYVSSRVTGVKLFPNLVTCLLVVTTASVVVQMSI